MASVSVPRPEPDFLDELADLPYCLGERRLTRRRGAVVRARPAIDDGDTRLEVTDLTA